MTTAERTTKHIVQAYKAVHHAKNQTQAKLDALLSTNPLYRFFEPDTRHPYYTLVSISKNTVDAYSVLIGGLLEWTVGGKTIADALDELKARQIVDDTDTDPDLDALRLIQPTMMSEAEAAEKLLDVYHLATSVWSKNESAMLKFGLAKLHGKRSVQRHKESPELKITADCRTAVTAIKKLGKELRDCGNGSSTIKQELEAIQLQRVSAGSGKDVCIEILLKT